MKLPGLKDVWKLERPPETKMIDFELALFIPGHNAVSFSFTFMVLHSLLIKISFPPFLSNIDLF